jgi:uncharacterized protein (TIGR02646 family)
MRTLKSRGALTTAAMLKLAKMQAALMKVPIPSDEAEKRFNAARRAKWFTELRKELRAMAGASHTCMYCDHNEPTDVEHFRPKSVFPDKTFSWMNMLWVCTTCNRLKLNSFPPSNCLGAELIDPVVDSVWDYFILDEFGTLIKRWDVVLGAYNQRADSTCKYIKIDREEVQTRRRKRMNNLKSAVASALGSYARNELSIGDLQNQLIEWLGEPFQADVADYYFRGPGRTERPFSSFLALGVSVPVA